MTSPSSGASAECAVCGVCVGCRPAEVNHVACTVSDPALVVVAHRCCRAALLGPGRVHATWPCRGRGLYTIYIYPLMPSTPPAALTPTYETAHAAASWPRLPAALSDSAGRELVGAMSQALCQL